jgi:Tol biopolymer transport system component
MRVLPVVCALLFLAVAVQGQAPSEEWRTISTTHYRVHHPVDYEEWAERAASRLESIHAAVSREVGYAPGAVIDVLVMNPIAQPNGSAWPFLDAPRIVFFTEAPGPEEVIGAYSNWIDLLAVHEVAHVVHMLRPSRDPVRRFIEEYLLPVSPITLDAPRWVLEGYATVLEGRLTGAGRPSSTQRALILRQWAANGRMPAYDELDGDQRFLGLSMAYLAGSAFLEWLEAGHGAGSLRNLWARMTARQERSFAESFTGVFGDSPSRMYGRFVAELTAAAMAANAAAPLREGELWQQTKWASGDPAVGPDGKSIAIVLRHRHKPARMVVWSTGPAEKEEKKYQERLDEIRRKDPEDVMPVRGRPLDREPLHSFTAPDGGDLSNPRWMPDGKSIVVTHRQPDARGVLHHDLFLWTPATGAWRRLTDLADVRDADPLPDGRAAIGIRSRHGFSELVRVDLRTGDVTSLSDPSIDVVYDHPRVSPDGRRLAYVAHRSGRWVIEVRGIIGGGTIATIAPDEGGFAAPEWTPDGSALIAAQMSGGWAELVRVRTDGTRTLLTRTSGGAMAPAPSPDGRIFFMSLDPDGFVLRVVEDGVAAGPPPFAQALVPAIPPRAPSAQAFAAETLAPSVDYGVGDQELTLLAGGMAAPGQNATEIGVRLGDVVGRLDTMAVASLAGDNAPRGFAVAGAWRGWPVEVAAHLFTAEDDLEERSGGELRAAWSRRAPRWRLALEAGGLAGKPFDLAFAEARFAAQHVSPAMTLSGDVLVGAESGSFQQIRGRAGGAVRRGSARLGIAYEYRSMDGGPIELGGLPSTIIPRSAYAHRVMEPALPVASLRGEDYQLIEVEAALPGIPLTFFYRRHELDVDVSLAGLQVEISSAPIPLIRLPGLDATLGVARPVSGGLPRDTNFWIGLRWRP